MRLTTAKSGPSGCFLPSKKSRRFLFVFSHTDKWWDKWLPGYTHVTLCEVIDDFLVVIDPLLDGSRIIFRTLPVPGEWAAYKVIEVVVRPTRANRLIRPTFQTCATIVQYLSGIDLGAVLVQGLYQRLVGSDTLSMDGIREIKIWEPQL